MKLRSFLPVLLVPLLLLLIPLVAMRFTTEVNWTALDFIAAWVMLTGAGVAYKLATLRAVNLAYRAAAGLAVFTGLLIVWGNLAVGFIGDEGNPANLMYAGVLVIGVVGALLARFQAAGLARALYATAIAQFLVPLIALGIWGVTIDPVIGRVIFLNTIFALLFAGAALLFRCSAGHAPTALTT